MRDLQKENGREKMRSGGVKSTPSSFGALPSKTRGPGGRNESRAAEGVREARILYHVSDARRRRLANHQDR